MERNPSRVPFFYGSLTNKKFLPVLIHFSGMFLQFIHNEIDLALRGADICILKQVRIMKQRYNVFNQIHKGLRAMLYDTALSLQLTDFSNTDHAAASIEKLNLVLDVFYAHASHEDKFILPLIQVHSPALVIEFDGEHEKDEFMTHRIHQFTAAYTHAGSADARLDAGDAIARAFNEFIAFNLYHMNKEEEKINPVLWKNYSDDQIRNIHKSIIANIPNDEMAITSKWMLLGINDTEIIIWLKNVKNNAPDFIFQSLLVLAEQVLPAARWERVQAGITEGVLLA
jgi:hypothetical protein